MRIKLGLRLSEKKTMLRELDLEQLQRQHEAVLDRQTSKKWAISISSTRLVTQLRDQCLCQTRLPMQVPDLTCSTRHHRRFSQEEE